MIDINIEHKSYPAQGRANLHDAIQDFNLTLTAGEFVCLVGPSGCGKTTLLNIIAELDNDYTGAIRFNNPSTYAKIGYVFQNPRLLPWRTVRENIELALDEGIAASSIDSLLEVMQLKKFEHVYPERLSLGMSRRVAIIRAFANNPELLLMDEPFVSLDAMTARQVRELLARLWQQRPHTVLFVTHDLREAIELADRIVFLTAAPMRVIDQVIIPLSRSQRQEENCIDDFRLKLINDYPHLKSLS
jgi:ABC-type nitrate/sulfonate/bicarbonate transport system ATPase subunit